MNLRDLVEKGRCVFVSCLKGPRTAEAHFKGCGKGVLFRADGYKSWRWLRLSINLLNSLFSGSPFYFVIMPHFVQKELEKSSVTKGFVRQQALKEKGEKKGETLLSAALLSRTAVAAAVPQLAWCVCEQELGGGGAAAKIPGACPVLTLMQAVVVTLSPHSPCPWLHWELALGPQLSQKSTARKPQLLAPSFLLRISPGGLK